MSKPIRAPRTHSVPEPPQSPNYPRFRNPDLDIDRTDEVDEPANKDDVEPPKPPEEPPDQSGQETQFPP
jgi:hypothetical protein